MVEKLLAIGPTGRIVACAFLLVVSAAAALQLPKLAVDRSDDKLISAQDPGWPALHQMEADFGDEQTVLVYVRADDLWTRERLLQLQNVVFTLEDMPGVTSISSLFTTTNIRDKGDYVEAGPLIDLVPRSDEKIAEMRDDAFYSPLMRRNVISSDGLATVISLSYESDPDDPDHPLKVFRQIEQRIDPLRADFDVVFQVGRPRLNKEIDDGLVEDLRVLVPAAIVTLLVTITIFLRSIRILPIPLITSTITLIWTFGFMATVGIPLTLLTAMVPALIIVIGSTEDVHLIAAYMSSLSGDPKESRPIAIRLMATKVGLPVLITALTTAFGFAANAITPIPLIREFAIASAFAMLANLVVTVLCMPLLLNLIGPRVNPIAGADATPVGIIGVIVRIIDRLSTRYPAMIVLLTIALLTLFGWQIAKVETNNDPLSYFQSDHRFVADANTLHHEIAGLKIFSVTLSSKTEGLFETPRGIAKIAAVQALLDTTGLFDRTQSLADIIALMHQEYHHGDTNYYRIPSAEEDVDLYLSSLTRKDLKAFVTADYSRARIMVRHNLSNSNLLNRSLDGFSKAVPIVLGPDVEFALVGKNLMINGAAESLISGQIASLLLILGIIFALFSILYTSVLAGLLSLVPNVIPVLLNFGLMGFLGVPLNPGTAMVAAIAIGVAVDDTVHLMTRFGAESRRHLNEADAVRATINGEAVPIVSTSIALALGFSVLGFSNFSIIAQFGLLAAATMIYALVCDLLLMPILLKHLRLATVWDIIALQLDREVLVRCPLFLGMSPYETKKVVLLSRMQDFDTGEVIIEKGSRSSGMYVVLKGEARVQFEQGELRLDIDNLKAGDVFGEIGFSGDDVERTATVVAAKPMTVVRLDAAGARKGLRFYPRIASRLHQNISNILGQRLVESHERLADVIKLHMG
ncbi:MAG: cyclic nucleotide-binding domain-containing protein [Proteobacteria bacterium]|nr:MAG: cyclic nucleotide-binding domain-containing protein [Pseudomonadota bacterium]